MKRTVTLIKIQDGKVKIIDSFQVTGNGNMPALQASIDRETELEKQGIYGLLARFEPPLNMDENTIH